MSKRNAKIVHLFALIALVANLFAPVFTQPVLAEDIVPSDPVVTSSTESDEAEAQRKADEEEAERKRLEEEARQKAEADAAATKAAEDAAATKAAEDAAATKAAEDAAAAKAAEDAAATKAAEDAAATKAAEDAAATKAAEDAAATKAAEDAAATKAAEDAAEEKSSDVVAPDNSNNVKTQQKVNAPAISLVPQDPQIQGCGDELSVSGAKGPAGITYSVQANGDGSHTVTAAIDASMQGSHTLNVEGTQWKMDGDVARYHVDPVPCPEAKTLGGPNHEVENITICHATGNDGHYTSNTVSWQAIKKNNGHWYHHDGRDIIPAFVDGNGDTHGPRPANAQEIIDNGCKPLKDTGVPKVTTVDATCGPNGYQPSKLTISAEGFKVLSTDPVAASSDVDADGMGTYTFENENDITVEVRIEVKKGYTYAGNSGWSYVQGSNPYIKYKSFTLKGTECEPELTIEKEAVYPPIYANGVSWKITVKNHGEHGENIRIVETSPDGTVYWELLDSGQYICDQDGWPVNGVNQWTCEDYISAKSYAGKPGERVYYFSSEMAKDCGSYDNTVTLQVKDGYTWETVGTSSSTFTKECSDPELSIEKELTKPHNGVASPGETIKFKVTVTNQGSGDAKNVTFTDIMSPELLALDWDLPQGCSWQDGSTILCATSKIKAGKNWSSTFSAIVSEDGSVCGEFTNTATLGGENGGVSTLGHIPQPKTSDSASVKIKCEPGIKIEKSADKSEVDLGDTYTYTVKVTNIGDTTLSGYVVTDQLDTDYLSFVSSEGNLCSESTTGSGLVTCDVADLTPVGQDGQTSQTFKITVQVADDLESEMCGTWIKNTAYVGKSDMQITSGGNNQSGAVEDTSNTVKTKLKDCDPKVEIKKVRTSSEIANPSDTITFEVTVKNSGSGVAKDVSFTDTMDAPLGDLDWEVDSDCDGENSSYNCGPFDLQPNGGERVFTFTATVPEDGTVCSDGWVYNRASIDLEGDNGQPEFQTTSGGKKGGKPQTEDSAKVKIKCDPGIKIEKDDQVGSVSPGQEFTYKITVTNTGNTELSGYVMTDMLPLDYLDFVGFGEGTTCDGPTASGEVTCEVATLSSSSGSGVDSQTFYITVKVKTALDPWMCDDQIENVASVAVADDGGVQISSHNNDEVSDSTTEVTKFKKGACKPNIDISKTDGLSNGESVEPGGSYTYTITVTNNGDIDAIGYIMTDTIADDLTFTTPDGCESNGQTIECDVPALEPGETWTVEIDVTLTDNPSGYVCKYGVRNMAEVQLAIVPLGEVSLSGGYGGQPSTYDKDVEYTSVNCDPDIDITKTASSENAEPGDPITYTITIENTGNLDLNNVVLADVLTLLPIGDWSFSSPDGVSCAIAFESLGCYIASMETGDVIEITLSGTITTAPMALTCFTGFINGAGVTANSSGGWVSGADSVHTRLNCDPSVELTKTALEDTVEPGGTLAFEIVFTNTGNVDVTNATINDNLPELPGGAEWEVTTVGASESVASFPYNVTDLKPSESVTLIARAQVPAELELTDNGNQWCKLWENTAKVNGKYSTSLFRGFNDKDSADIQVNCTGVSIVKEAPASVEPGESLTYTIQVTNMGNTTVNMTVTDILDDRLSNVVATVTAPSGTSDCGIVDDSEVNCPINNLAEGEVATITITADVIATPTPEQCDELILNRASISPAMAVLRQSQSVTIPQQYPLNSNEVETSINCEPDLEVEKEGPSEAVQPGDDIVFTVTVRNVGTYPTTTSITDGLPTGLAGLTWNWSLNPDDSGADCGWIGGSIVCDDIALDGYGDELVITLTATTDVQNPVCGEYTNQAGITTGSRDQLVSADVVIDCEPDYEIEKTSSMTVDADEDGQLSLGDTIEYTITVTNTGNQHLSGITLDDQFAGDGGLTWIAPEGFDGENVPTVNVGDSIDLVATYVITQADVDIGEIENCALMTYQVDDESSLDRDDCVDDEIEQTPDYAVEKTSANTDDADDNGALSEGDTITYTITVTNTGNLTLNNIMLDDQFTGAGDGGLTWIAPEGFDGENVPTVNVGDSIDLVATYVITQADVDAGEIENCALMTYQVDEETEIARDDCVDDPLEQEPVFTVEKTSANTDDADDDGAISEGDTITYTITVTNTGNLTLDGITLDDQFSGDGNLTWTAPEGFDGENVPTVNVGSSIDLVATYVITQADVDEGEIENCALMTYQVDEETVIERDDCAEDEIPQDPSVSIEKVGTATDNPDVLALGNIVTYTFTVTNTGDVTLTDLEIEDPMEGVRFEDGNVIESLAPGETVQKRARYSVAQLDMNNGLIVNCADIIAMAPDGSEVTDDSCDTRLIDQNLSLAVAHECPGFDDGVLLEAGDAVEFEITVSNPGNVSVHNVTVVPTREGAFNEPFSSTFEPGQEETRIYTVIATAEEAETLEVHVGFTVTGDMQAGVNQLMASMAMMQSTGDRTTSSTDFDCGLGERPVPEVPDTPFKPATDSAVKAVSQLPNTGSGSVASVASVLWAAAMLSVFALGATAVGIRVKHRR